MCKIFVRIILVTFGVYGVISATSAIWQLLFAAGVYSSIVKCQRKVGRPLLVKIPKPDRLDLGVSDLLLDIPIFILYSSFGTTQLLTGLHAFYSLITLSVVNKTLRAR